MLKLSRPIIFYNSEQYIVEAIESVIDQSYSNWELVLIDDGSSDNSTMIAKGYVEKYSKRIRYFEHENHQNKGMSASRNLGISKSNGMYFCFLDSDDIYMPQKIKNNIKIMCSYPEVEFIVAATEYWYSWTGNIKDREKDRVWMNFGVKPRSVIEPPILLFHFINDIKTAPCIGSFLIKKKAIHKVGLFIEEFKGLYEDQAFITKLYHKTRGYVCDECLDKYRKHPESSVEVSKSKGTIQTATINFLNWVEEYFLENNLIDLKIWKALIERRQKVINNYITNSYTKQDYKERLNYEEKNKEYTTKYEKLLNSKDEWKSIAKERSEKLKQVRNRLEKSKNRISLLKESKLHWKNIAEERKIKNKLQDKKIKSFKAKGINRYLLFLDTYTQYVYLNFLKIIKSIYLISTKTQPDTNKTDTKTISGKISGKLEAKTDLLFKRSLNPVSKEWGFDRGVPIDRYYIEDFIKYNSAAIKGKILEINDNRYTIKYGKHKVIESDVLDINENNTKATIIADITDSKHISTNKFDCIIFTQTLQLIYDFESAIKTLHRILNKNGVLLVTFPGITKILVDRNYGWYWNFTTFSAEKIFNKYFHSEDLHINRGIRQLAKQNSLKYWLF